MDSIIDNSITDKNTRHSYIEVYQPLFEKFENDHINILEIGIWEGGSIKLWADYFKNASVHACDINNPPDWLKTYSDRITFHIGDAYSQVDFGSTKFSIMIDDGPHTLDSMKYFAKYYSEMLTDDGILVIEDVRDINWFEEIRDSFPEELRSCVELIDRREVKNRHDDVLIVLNKEKLSK